MTGNKIYISLTFDITKKTSPKSKTLFEFSISAFDKKHVTEGKKKNKCTWPIRKKIKCDDSSEHMVNMQ